MQNARECRFEIAKPLMATIVGRWKEKAPKLRFESYIRGEIKERLIQEKTRYNRMEEEGFKLKVGKKTIELDLEEKNPEKFEILSDQEKPSPATEPLIFDIPDLYFQMARKCALLSNAILDANEKDRLGLGGGYKFESLGEFLKMRIVIPTFQSARDEEEKSVVDEELKEFEDYMKDQEDGAKKTEEAAAPTIRDAN